jgi:hypothetical protein
MFNTQDFLSLAKDMLKSKDIPKNEAFCRSVISRSYYAAFLTTREKIEKLDPNILTHEKVNSHDEVTRCLCYPRFSNQDIDLPDTLKELKKFRIEADYHFPNACYSGFRCRKPKYNPDNPAAVHTCIGLAQNIINRVSLLK